MRRAIGILVASIVALPLLLGAAVAAVHLLADRKAQRTVSVQVATVPYATDAAAVERGRYLYATRGCAECHAAQGNGKVVIDEPSGLFVRSANITAGQGSAVSEYGPVDWVRAIRHGVARDGRPLLIMPSEDYNRLTDADLAALVAYVRALPPLAGAPAEIRFPTLVKTLYAVGVVKDGAEKIDHALPPSRPVPATASVEHGAYVANMCIGCHGAGFSGGAIPGTPPSWPPAANLTRGSNSAMLRYDTPEKFMAMMRSGQRPDGSTVSKVMPFASLAALDDTDLRALHAFLWSLPPREAGSR